MSLRCKPGDLAMIVLDDIPENVGRYVEVLEPAVPGIHVDRAGRLHKVDSDPCPMWWVQAAGSILVQIEGFGIGPYCYAVFPDSWLRPIRDGGLPDETLAYIGTPETVSA